ncbi:rab-GTPase-TBC domain-containing protein [Chlamydoabsidia padenii]|nr:rab-GTPase-TBC domain-containing protein [Chlamydoabsidia padenii]
MKKFREACFQGIPEESGLRATAWKVLTGYLPPDKRFWHSTIYRQRLSYYNLVKELLEPQHEELVTKDQPSNVTPESKWSIYIQDNNTLEQIDKDVRRTLPDLAFFQQKVPQNPLNPLSALLPPTGSIDENDTKRRFSFGIMGRPRSGSSTSKKSLKINNYALNNSNMINSNSNNLTVTGNRSRSNSKSSVRSVMMENGVDMMNSPRNIVRKLSTAFSKSNSTIPTSKQQQKQFSTTLKPICPYIHNRRSLFKRIQQHNHDDDDNDNNDDYRQDYHWEVIERILFIYAKLNPGIGYVQGMNELLAPIYFVFANDMSSGLAGQVHAEADTFFAFTSLMSDVRDHFVRSLDQDAGTGIHSTMFRLQQRVAWYDNALWRELQRKNVKEPYYAFRWIAVLFTQEWNLANVIRLWDSLLAERGMVSSVPDTPFEFLLDFAVAMLVCVRQELFKSDFAECIHLLQNYPHHDIQHVLTMANVIRETRLQMVAVGQIIPGVNDVRHTGIFNGDWSDTSSLSSTTSTTSTRLQQRLRESTRLARSSFDSFRRDSKESMDDIFRRAVSGEHWKRASTGDMKRSLSQRIDLVKSNVLNKTRRSGSVRSTYSESPSSVTLQKHWLLANQFNTDQQRQHVRSNSTNDIPQRVNTTDSNVLNRFSHMIISGQNTISVNPSQRVPHQAPIKTIHTQEEDEKLVFAKAAAARDQALYYRTTPTYNGCV